jgi:hypothetical protein
MDPVEQSIDELRRTMPTFFLGTKVHSLTGGAVNWGTLMNKKSRGEIPNAEEMFLRLGNRNLVVRDPFLGWLEAQLRQARQLALVPPPRRVVRSREPDLADPPASTVGRDIRHQPHRARGPELPPGRRRRVRSDPAAAPATG